jgi:hypothetical protein
MSPDLMSRSVSRGLLKNAMETLPAINCQQAGRSLCVALYFERLDESAEQESNSFRSMLRFARQHRDGLCSRPG